MLKCRKFRKLIDLYLDGEADDNQARILFSHIEDCGDCKVKFQEVERLNHAIRSVSAVDLPAGFRGKILAQMQNEGIQQHRRMIRFLPVMGVAVALIAFFLVLTVEWKPHTPEPILPVPGTQAVSPSLPTSEIHIVSPREDSVIEREYVDISAVFNIYGERNIRVILDSRDVTDATEINEDFLIYTSDELEDGYHIAIIQVTDPDGEHVTHRSWSFYVMRT